MERAEFSESQVWLHFYSVAGGRCECDGCLFFHTGRCKNTFTYEQRSTSDGTGWQADHHHGAFSNSFSNLRIMCVDCHKMTPTYGRNDATLGLGALATLGLPPSPPKPSLSQTLASAYNPPPQDFLGALGVSPVGLGPLFPAAIPEPAQDSSLSSLVRAIMSGQKKTP